MVRDIYKEEWSSKASSVSLERGENSAHYSQLLMIVVARTDLKLWVESVIVVDKLLDQGNAASDSSCWATRNRAALLKEAATYQHHPAAYGCGHGDHGMGERDGIACTTAAGRAFVSHASNAQDPRSADIMKQLKAP
jgi:hypothetical protein